MDTAMQVLHGLGANLIWLGVAVPGLLLLLGTSFAVFRLGRLLQGLEPDARPPWQLLLGHVALGIGGAIVIPVIGLLAWFVLPTLLFRRYRRARDEVDFGGYDPEAIEWEPPTRSWGVAGLITATGLFLPWATGLGVKVYLDSLGRPTHSVSEFLDPVMTPILLILTLATWAFPFLILASAVVVPWRVGFANDPWGRASLLPIWLAYGAGAVLAVPMFVAVFWEFDSMMLLVPVGTVLLVPMGIGYLAGWWILRRQAEASFLPPE